MKSFGICINWKVLLGLAAVGVGMAFLAPKLLPAALPLLVAALCPLSMLLMMGVMNGGMMGQGAAKSPRRQRQGVKADTALSREEQLARLREQLQSLQSQQADIANQINALKQDEQALTSM